MTRLNSTDGKLYFKAHRQLESILLRQSLSKLWEQLIVSVTAPGGAWCHIV